MSEVKRPLTMFMSPFRQHVEKWKNCILCPLCETRKHVVIARGSLPADILIVGEAPGDNEDVLGKPFVGPAGKLLDEILVDALEGLGIFSLAWTNILGCIPIDANREKNPQPKDIKTCRPRLVEIVRLAKPKLIVLAGKLVAKYVTGQLMFEPVKWTDAIQFVEVDHPAFILRMPDAQRGLAEQRCKVRIRCAVQELVNAKA